MTVAIAVNNVFSRSASLKNSVPNLQGRVIIADAAADAAAKSAVGHRQRRAPIVADAAAGADSRVATDSAVGDRQRPVVLDADAVCSSMPNCR